MRYSCFDADTGLYRVFVDDRGHAINSDLPVPKLGSDRGGIGVPSIESARELPADARFVGTSWNARGVIVRCPGESLGSDFDLGRAWSSFGPVVIVGGLGLWLWWAWRRMDQESKERT